MMTVLRWLVQAGVLAVAAVQLAGFAQALHPFFDSVAHFRAHLAVLLAIGVILLLLLRSWRVAAGGVAVIAATLVMMGPAVGWTKPLALPALSLLQFNTLFKNPAPTAIVAQVKQLRPDVIMLQEVSSKTAAIMAELKADYPQQLLCNFAGVGGVAVLSRHALLKQWCAEGEGVAWMRLVIEGREVTVASVHMHWPWPYGQAEQISGILPHLAQLPQPIVIAGDFNAAPWSHAVARIAEATGTEVAPGLRPSLKMAPLGFGPWPMLPIDHVLVPQGAVASVRLLPSAGSDHLPLIARISLP